MAKKYAFKFQGTKESFLDVLNQFQNYNGKCYYINDYIVDIVDDKIHFGVARGGHSGGYWFIPTITECDDRIEFDGTIKYIGPKENQGAVMRAIDNIGEFLLLIFLLPIILVFKIYTFIAWCVRKIRKCEKPKEQTEEDKLYDLMENYLNCIRLTR